MSFGSQESYRIGDWLKAHPGGGGGNPPDGEYAALVTDVALASTKDGRPQLKIVTKLVSAGGRQYTYYYPLWKEMLWKLFEDALAAGCPPDFDPGPIGPHWLEAFRPGFINQTFTIALKTQGDFQNVKIIGRGGDNTLMTTQPQPVPAAFPGGGNTPRPVQPEAQWAPTMQPHGPEPTAWGGGPTGAAAPEGWGNRSGATETQMVDAASLFKNA